MARQSRLEKEGIQSREETLLKNFYQEGTDTEYSENHEDAQTHDDENHPWGKGDSTYQGESYAVPDETKSKTQIKPQINTVTGGGSYDKYGRNGIGGREYLSGINIYSKDNAYGTDSVDTSVNVNDYDQYTFTTRTISRK